MDVYVKMGLHLCACEKAKDWHQMYSSSNTILFSETYSATLARKAPRILFSTSQLRLQEGTTAPGFLFFFPMDTWNLNSGLMLRQQALYLLSHLLGPVNNFFFHVKKLIHFFFFFFNGQGVCETKQTNTF